MPKRQRMAVAMGAPVYPPKKPTDAAEVEQVVEAMHKEYYDNLRKVYDEFKVGHAKRQATLCSLTRDGSSRYLSHGSMLVMKSNRPSRQHEREAQVIEV